MSTPEPTEPRFKVGDPVWSFNGEARVVHSMRWAQAMPHESDPPGHVPHWGWVVESARPESPGEVWGSCWEWSYAPREPDSGPVNVEMAEACRAYWGLPS